VELRGAGEPVRMNIAAVSGPYGPLGRGGAQGVSEVVFFRPDTKDFLTVKLAPARNVAVDGDVRIKLAEENLPAGEVARTTLTLTTGGELAFFPTVADVPDEPGIEKWFPFQPNNDAAAPSAIDMSGWIEKPAGKDGFLRKQGGHIVRPDGTPVKLWGTNVEYAENCPPKESAEKRARWYAKYGINAVRMHKVTNPGWEGMGTTESAATYDAEKMEKFDYFTAQMRENGVYYGFSPIWDLKVFPGDKAKLAAYDELVDAAGRGNTTGAVWFADDVQDLHIEAMLNLITHRNEHTGLRYAEDPALAYIEIQNEEDVFWYSVAPRVMGLPTYRKIAEQKFCAWLRKRYATEEGLLTAWGKGAFDFGEVRRDGVREGLDANNIYPYCNPWFYDNIEQKEPLRRRLMDTAEFLYELQNGYYSRMTRAIREAGYPGIIVGSNWQAGSTVAHYWNLLSDAETGIVDRHNYMGGTGNWFIGLSRLHDVTMLDEPGSALLSTGMQQVEDAPFSVSEWMSIHPTQWNAASVPIMAAYGMGLNGWDMSYFFASNGDGFSDTLIYPGTKCFNNQTPNLIGMFPALSRMVLRGDVAEGQVFSRRKVSLNQLRQGQLTFRDGVEQQHDLKSFSGDVPHAAMAVGRTVITFTDEDEPFEKPDVDAHREGDTLVSTTRQLRWTATGRRHEGCVTVDTPGTQAVVGFAPAKEIGLGELTVTPSGRFSVLYVTAAEPGEKIADAKRLLISVVARARNTGMKIYGEHVLTLGTAPIMLEPVQAKVALKRAGGTVHVLDHDGRRTGRTIPAPGGVIDIDTGRDKALYYEVVYP